MSQEKEKPQVAARFEVANLDTVFGLSLTSTGVGWVLVEGPAADGAIVDHEEFAVQSGGGSRAAGTATQVAAAVQRAEESATADGGRLRSIGVTWSDDAAAGAALLIEQLTAAGFDNIVPVRWIDAAETLARGLAPVVGYDNTAVCVLAQESTTVVMIDTCDGDARTAVKGLKGGSEGQLRWVTQLFDRDGWRPGGVVLVGSGAELDGLSSKLNDALPLPVFAQSGVELAVARGAALASVQDAGLSDTPWSVSATETHEAVGGAGSRARSYTGAMAALVAASVTLVGSLSLAVGLRLTPDESGTADDVQASGRVVHAQPAPRVAVVPIAPPAPAPPPAAEPRPAAPAPAAAQPSAPLPDEQTTVSSDSAGAVPEPPAVAPPVAAPAAPPPPAPEEPPPDPHPLLTKVLDLIHGHPQDPPPADPPPPASP
jgi:hypothetical protein